MSRDPRNLLVKMIGRHRKIVRRTISRGRDPNNKNEPYTGLDRRSGARVNYKGRYSKKRKRKRSIRTLETSDYARAATSDIGKSEKRSSPKTLSPDIMFARAAKRYRNATAARQPPNAATDERKLGGKIASTRRQWRDEGSCIRGNSPVGLPLRNRVLINATVSRRDDALTRPSRHSARSSTLLIPLGISFATRSLRDIVIACVFVIRV